MFYVMFLNKHFSTKNLGFCLDPKFKLLLMNYSPDHTKGRFFNLVLTGSQPIGKLDIY